MVETFAMKDVFLVDWDFLEGEGCYFSIGLRFSHGTKIIPSELSFLSGCSRFSRGWKANFFSGGGLERYIITPLPWRCGN